MLKQILVVALSILLSTYCTAMPPFKGKIYTPGDIHQFKALLQTNDFVIVDFFAEWCSACKQMKKAIESLAQDKEFDNILFVNINTEYHRALAAEYHVFSLPTVILFVDGTPIHTVYGYYDKKTLKQIIRDTFFSY